MKDALLHWMESEDTRHLIHEIFRQIFSMSLVISVVEKLDLCIIPQRGETPKNWDKLVKK
jgi:hypothetical protein